MIHVLLVDDHAAFRQPLALMMAWEPDLTVVAQAGSLAEARRMLAAAPAVDVAVVDLQLPDGNGVDLIPALRTANPQGTVLILTASMDQSAYARAMEAGAAGVVQKLLGIREIIALVRRLSRGEHLPVTG